MNHRQARVAQEIRARLATVLTHRIRDPRLDLVTITGVEVTRDLDTAKVFFTVMGGESEREESKQGLESAKNFLRKTIGRELKLRNIPDLRFVYDDSLDRSMRIEDTLKQIHEDDEETTP